VRSNPHWRTVENLRVSVFSRQSLVRVVNHTLLLTRSVSRLSTKRSVQWGKTLTHTLLRTSEFVSAVSCARGKSHTTPDTECVTILYKKYQFSEVKTSQSHFWEPPIFPQQLLVRIVNHTLLLMRSVSRFSIKRFVEWDPTLTFAPLRTSEFFFPRQLLVRVVNHTLLLIQSVSRSSAQYQFSESKPSHTHFWEPPSLSRCVVNPTLLLVRSVSRLSTKRSVQWGKTLTVALLRTFEFVLGSYSCAKKSHTTPNAECVSILYKISVQWGQTLTHAFVSTRSLF